MRSRSTPIQPSWRAWLLPASTALALTACGVDDRKLAVQPDDEIGDPDAEPPSECPRGDCDAGPVEREPELECRPGETQCVGTTPRTCAPEGEWVAAAPCSGELPVCVPETASCICEEGSSVCVSESTERRCAEGRIVQSGCDADSLCDPDRCRIRAWTRQFGAPGSSDFAHSVGLDPNGNVIVAGITFGALPGQPHSGGQDSFIQKHDPLGNVLWTRQFGLVNDTGIPIFVITHAVAVDASGNAIVGGQVGNGSLPNQLVTGGAFIRKYGPGGNELWTRQFTAGEGSFAEARSLRVDASGNLLVAGNQSSGAFVSKFDPNGDEPWTALLENGFVQGHALGSDAGGNVLVAGRIARKYAPDGAELWTLDTTMLGGAAECIEVDGAGNVLILINGDSGVVLGKYDPDGNVLWTSPVASSNGPHSLRVDESGNILVAGNVSEALPGQMSFGEGDVFVKVFDAEGNERGTRQIGSSAFDRVFSVGTDEKGSILLAGQTSGALSADSISGGGDAFVLKLVELAPAP